MRPHQIDAVASQPHFVDHLAPVWRALPAEAQGTFWAVSRPLQRYARTLGVDAQLGRAYTSALCLVASAHDLGHGIGSQTRAVFVEHGAGQTYIDWPSHPSYAGGDNRHAVVLFLALNAETAAKDQARWPAADVEVVGSPRVDELRAIRNARHATGVRPVVAFCWHYDEGLVPETRTAFPYWRDAVCALRSTYDVVGSGHPRAWHTYGRWYRAHGIEAVPEFTEVVRRADVVCFDNTSAAYEAAACGIPVIALNSPRWRKDVEHGLRLWSRCPGPQLDDPADLAEMVGIMLGETWWHRRRAEVVDTVYPPHTRGRAARLAADAITARLVSAPRVH